MAVNVMLCMHFSINQFKQLFMKLHDKNHKYIIHSDKYIIKQ